ncbi:MAG: chromate transporter [Lachnospiraceae bacterium]|nr:chromate transporter [Lachnospiraceae bacterium]
MNKKLFTLFFATLKISAFTFGGGFVIIPLLRRKFVEDLKWIDEEEMLDLIAVAQSSPGAVAVNASILVGYRVAGLVGAFVAVLGTIIPPLFIISVISFFYRAFRDNKFVSVFMAGMLCGVAAVILDVVISMLGILFKNKEKDKGRFITFDRVLSFILLVGAFVANRYFKINIIFIILVCALFGVARSFYEKKKGGDRS